MRVAPPRAVAGRRRRRFSTSVILVALVSGMLVGGGETSASPSDVDEVVAYLVEGTGNGHGRGLSQWGAYGWAVDHGKDWPWILDHYYGGTVMGDIDPAARIRVRLTGWDGDGSVVIIAPGASGSWSAGGIGGGPYPVLRVRETATDTFEIATATSATCSALGGLTVPDGPIGRGSADSSAVRQVQTFLTAAGHDPNGIDGDFGPATASALRAFQIAQGLDPVDEIWSSDEAARARDLIAASASSTAWEVIASGLVGPVRISSSVDESATAAGDQLGVCADSGAVTHYRGALELWDTADGNRLVNDVAVEDYLRGVVPRESPASWGTRGDGAGMNALRAQSVAARSYGVRQERYRDEGVLYAGTCDTSSCQVYGGAASRGTATETAVSKEHPLTDQAIRDTAGKVRRWASGNLAGEPVGDLVSTEFSSSNGPRTAGGNFPSVEDPGDAVAINPWHRWTRLISVEDLRDRYPSADPDRVTTIVDGDSPYVGIYENEVRLDDGVVESAWDFRRSFGLPSPGFTLTPVRRGVVVAQTMAFIGDSVGESITGDGFGRELPTLLDGVFTSTVFDAVSSRRTQGGSIQPDGVAVASQVPQGTDLVVVALGYNDDPAAMADRIDALLDALVARGVGTVAWVTMSERRTDGDGDPRFAPSNEALREARGRWPQLVVLDWAAASEGPAADRWYSDGVHLTTTGQARYATWLRDEVLALADPTYVAVGSLEHHVPLRPARVLDTRSSVGVSGRARVDNSEIEVRVLGEGGVPGTDVAAVALNITVVDGSADRFGGFVTVHPCGLRPDTSNLNFAAGDTVANSVIAPVSDTGTICLFVRGQAHLLADVSGYFPATTGFRSLSPARIVDTRQGIGAQRVQDAVVTLPVAGRGGLPETGIAAVALNLTVTGTTTGAHAGYVTLYPCGEVPDVSNVNFSTDDTVANAVVVPLADDGTLCASVFGGAHLILDAFGYFPEGSGFVPVAPRRAADTRQGERVGDLEGTGAPLEVTVVDSLELDGRRVVAAALNLTVVDAEANRFGGYVTVYPCGTRPDASNLNFVTGMTVANGVMAPVSRTGTVCIHLYGRGDVLVDVNGVITS
ncbi:MAG: SpoIID/LytB domain-containing protein [Ilumatobacteraceae bacterium]